MKVRDASQHIPAIAGRELLRITGRSKLASCSVIALVPVGDERLIERIAVFFGRSTYDRKTSFEDVVHLLKDSTLTQDQAWELVNVAGAEVVHDEYDNIFFIRDPNGSKDLFMGCMKKIDGEWEALDLFPFSNNYFHRHRNLHLILRIGAVEN